MNQLNTSKHCLFFCCCKLGNKKKFQKQKYCYDIGCTASCCFCVFLHSHSPQFLAY